MTSKQTHHWWSSFYSHHYSNAFSHTLLHTQTDVQMHELTRAQIQTRRCAYLLTHTQAFHYTPFTCLQKTGLMNMAISQWVKNTIHLLFFLRLQWAMIKTWTTQSLNQSSFSLWHFCCLLITIFKQSLVACKVLASLFNISKLKQQSLLKFFNNKLWEKNVFRSGRQDIICSLFHAAAVTSVKIK